MKPLHQLTARLEGQSRIKFKWDYQGFDTAQYVYIYSIDPNGRADGQYRILYDISKPQDPQDNLSFSITCEPSVASLRILRFAVFCSADWAQPPLEQVSKLAGDPQYVVQVLTGHANITWSEKARKVGDLKLVSFSITSDTVVPPGILGYVINGVNLHYSFPMQIGQDTIRTPSILIRADQNPTIVPLDPSFAVNFTIRKRTGLFSR